MLRVQECVASPAVLRPEIDLALNVPGALFSVSLRC